MSLKSNKPATKYNFSGSFDLDNVEGIIYEDYVQTGALALSVSSSRPKGNALIAITANGSAITVPSGWVLYGGDEISIVNGDVNHLSVLCKDASTILYVNKVL